MAECRSLRCRGVRAVEVHAVSESPEFSIADKFYIDCPSHSQAIGLSSKVGVRGSRMSWFTEETVQTNFLMRGLNVPCAKGRWVGFIDVRECIHLWLAVIDYVSRASAGKEFLPSSQTG